MPSANITKYFIQIQYETIISALLRTNYNAIFLIHSKIPKPFLFQEIKKVAKIIAKISNENGWNHFTINNSF